MTELERLTQLHEITVSRRRHYNWAVDRANEMRATLTTLGAIHLYAQFEEILDEMRVWKDINPVSVDEPRASDSWRDHYAGVRACKGNHTT